MCFIFFIFRNSKKKIYQTKNGNFPIIENTTKQFVNIIDN